MGCCRSNPNQTKDEKDQELIELSFKLNTPLPHPCIGLKQFVVRDGSGTSEVDGLSTLLDDLDNILERTRFNTLLVPLIFLFVYVVALVPLLILEKIEQLWIPVVVAIPIVASLFSWKLFQRRAKMMARIDNWNRIEGKSQGKIVRLGVEHEVSPCKFFCAAHLICCNEQASIHVCRVSVPV